MQTSTSFLSLSLFLSLHLYDRWHVDGAAIVACEESSCNRLRPQKLPRNPSKRCCRFPEEKRSRRSSVAEGPLLRLGSPGPNLVLRFFVPSRSQRAREGSFLSAFSLSLSWSLRPPGFVLHFQNIFFRSKARRGRPDRAARVARVTRRRRRSFRCRRVRHFCARVRTCFSIRVSHESHLLRTKPSMVGHFLLTSCEDVKSRILVPVRSDANFGSMIAQKLLLFIRAFARIGFVSYYSPF